MLELICLDSNGPSSPANELKTGNYGSTGYSELIFVIAFQFGVRLTLFARKLVIMLELICLDSNGPSLPANELKTGNYG